MCQCRVNLLVILLALMQNLLSCEDRAGWTVRMTPYVQAHKHDSPSEMLSGDLVAVWDVALSDSVYRIEFAHGTTTGKRIICVNGQVRLFK